MKKKIIILLLITITLLTTYILIKQPKDNSSTSENSESLTSLRLGWQTPWATQGQLTQILTNTDIATKQGLKLDLKGFDSGAPLNEAALGSQVDVLFTADQPAISLISKSDNWVIIGRLMYNRVSLYVPPNSPITTVGELRGKTVAVPFGTAAQKMLLVSEKAAGLDPKTDVNNINLGIYEQSDVVKDNSGTTWGSIDAMAGFDPTPAIFEEKGLIRNIKTDTVVSVVVMSKKFIQQNPEAPSSFMSALKESYTYFRQNTLQANKWFKEAAKLEISDQALAISAAVEPNLMSTSETIRLDFTDDDFSRMQETADFLYTNQLIKTAVDVKNHVEIAR